MRLRLGLVARLTLILLVVTLIGMTVMGVYVTGALETRWVEQLRAALRKDAALLQDEVLPLLAAEAPSWQMQQVVDAYGAKLGSRVTVIARDGTVLGDSERDVSGARQMDNHASRPEVRAALAGRNGTDVRRSRTLDVDMLYVAVPAWQGERLAGVVRLALPLTEVARTSAAIRRSVGAGAVLAFAVVLAVGLFISRRVTRPVSEMRAIANRMAEGALDRPVTVTGGGEIGELGQALNRMASRLKEEIEDLDRERTRVTAVLESMVEGVIAIDDRGRIFVMNPAARAIFGLSEEPLEGRGIIEVLRHKELLDLLEECRRCRPGADCRREIEVGPPIGRILEAHAAGVPFDSQGTGALLVLHDITDLRRLERVRTEFVANVSHELRTPLTSIRGYLETLLDGALDEPRHARRFLEVASSHAERLGRLVDELLQLSDIETGKAKLTLAPVVLADVVGDVAAILERHAHERRLTLLRAVPADLTARADRDTLAQILVNLLDNAIKHTPEGGRIEVSARPRAGGFAEIRVTDTGIGIPSADLPRITERFYRVDKARSRAMGGTGLGLAIVKHLVHAHGGRLRIESELGKGTIVSVVLPAA